MANILRKRYFNTKPPLGAQLDTSHPLSQGLVGCWLMNEGGGKIATNLGQYPGSGTYVNNPQFIGQGVKFVAASSQYVDLGSKYSFGNNDFTFIQWFNPQSSVNSFSLSSRSPAPGYGYEILCGSGGVTTNYQIRYAGVSGVTGVGFTITNTNNIQQIAATFKKSPFLLNIYVAGKLVAKSSTTDPGSIVNTQNLRIASRGTTYFSGIIYLTLVYNRVLSPSEIQSLDVAQYQMVKPRTVMIGYGADGGAVNQTITPALLELASNLQALNVNYDFVITPSTLDLTASLQSPLVFTGMTITPDVLSLSASVLSPTVKFDYLYALAALNLTATLLSPDVSGGQIISISPLELTAGLLSPTVTFDQIIALAALNLTAALQTTTFKYDFAVDITALAISAGVLDPTVTSAAGRTYLVFDSANNRLQLWVGGTEVARFNQDGSIDVNGVVTQNAF